MGVKHLVTTAMGNCLLDPSVEVYVQITSDRYLVKSVADLKPGDLVLYSKPHTTADLEDVDPELMKSPRYAVAKDLLHEINRHGEYVPKLRGLLIRGFAKQGIVSPDGLEARILREDGNDFTPEEYESMEERLYRMVTVGGEQHMSAAGVRNWLEGTVIAPRDWSLFPLLAERLNSEFSAFQDACEDPTSMYFNYRLYVTIRQGIMRFLNDAKGIHPDEKGKQGKSKISLTPEYQIVFNHFLKDVSLNYACARVMRVTKIDRQRQVEHMMETDPLLSEGIVRKSPKIQLSEKTIAEVIEDNDILCQYLLAAAEDFECGPIIGYEKTPPRLDRWQFALLMGPYFYKYFKEPLDADLKRVLDNDWSNAGWSGVVDEKKIRERIGVFADRIRDAILSGELDTFFSFERGTMMRILESNFRTRTAIPDRIHTYHSHEKAFTVSLYRARLLGQDFHFSRKEKKELEHERQKLEVKYGLRYDEHGDKLQDGLFVTQFFPGFFPRGIDKKPLFESLSMREHLEKIENDPEALRKILSLTQQGLKGEVFLRTRAYTAKVLGQYGLAHIVDLRKQDFYFENLR